MPATSLPSFQGYLKRGGTCDFRNAVLRGLWLTIAFGRIEVCGSELGDLSTGAITFLPNTALRNLSAESPSPQLAVRPRSPECRELTVPALAEGPGRGIGPGRGRLAPRIGLDLEFAPTVRKVDRRSNKDLVRLGSRCGFRLDIDYDVD